MPLQKSRAQRRHRTIRPPAACTARRKARCRDPAALRPKTRKHEMTSDPHAEACIHGNLRSADGKSLVQIKANLEAAPGAVWSALTDPVRLALWYGEVTGDLQPDGEYRAHISASGSEGSGHIESCETPHRLVVTGKEPDARPVLPGGPRYGWSVAQPLSSPALIPRLWRRGDRNRRSADLEAPTGSSSAAHDRVRLAFEPPRGGKLRPGSADCRIPTCL